MGISKKRDGRYVVGKGITDSNEYKGSAGWRDMVIQYTASGATEKSLEYLEYLRDYALYHSGKGEPIIPPNVSIWLSTEDTMKAVEADDISVSGETVSIGAVTWDGSDWTFGTPSSGGGSGSGLPTYTSSDIGKVLTVGEAEPVEAEVVVVPEQTVTVSQGTQYYYASLADVSIDWPNAKAGDSINLTVNGSKYTANYSADAFGAPAFVAMNGSNPVAAVADTGTEKAPINMFLTMASGDYTVSATAVQSVTPTVQTVVVPEQTVTVTFPDVAYLTDADVSFFVHGTTASMSVNGEARSVTAEADGDVILFIYDEHINIGLDHSTGEVSLATDASGTYTVSLIAPTPKPEPKWKAAGGILFIKAVQGGTYDSDTGVLSIPVDTTIDQLMEAVDQESFSLKQPIFVDLPAVTNIDNAEYGYSDGELLVMLTSAQDLINTKIGTVGSKEFALHVVVESGVPTGVYLACVAK